MPVNIQSPEAVPSAQRAPSATRAPSVPETQMKKILSGSIFIFLNLTLMIISGRDLCLTVLYVGLLPNFTIERLLGIHLFWGSIFVYVASLAFFLCTLTVIGISIDAKNMMRRDVLFIVVTLYHIGLFIALLFTGYSLFNPLAFIVVYLVSLILFARTFMHNSIIIHYNGKNVMLYTIGLFLALIFTGGSLLSQLGFHNQLKTGLESGIAKGMLSFNASIPDASNAYALQWTQVKYDCCGWKGPQDYQTIIKGKAIPLSCCAHVNFPKSNPFATCKIADVVRPGCLFSDLYKYADTLNEGFIIQSVLLIVLICMTSMKSILAKDVEAAGNN